MPTKPKGITGTLAANVATALDYSTLETSLGVYTFVDRRGMAATATTRGVVVLYTSDTAAAPTRLGVRGSIKAAVSLARQHSRE